MLQAVQASPVALEFAHRSWLVNREWALAATEACPSSSGVLHWLTHWRGDRDIVLAAVRP